MPINLNIVSNIKKNNIKAENKKQSESFSINRPSFQSKDKVSFQKATPEVKGLSSKVQDGFSSIIEKIETGGFLTEFLVIDAFGMMLPRTWQAFHRNEEELGHPNYKAGTEEVIREALTGPSFFLIPMGLRLLTGKTFGDGAKIKPENTEQLGKVFSGVLEDINKTGAFSDNNFSEKFFGKVFDKGFEGYKEKIGTDFDSYRTKFVEHLQNYTENKDKKALGELTNITKELNLKSNINVEKPQSTKLLGDIGTLVTDTANYTRGVIDRLKGKVNDVQNFDKEFVTTTFKTLHKNSIRGKKIINILSLLAISGFLYSIPLFYKRNKENPGTDGIKDKGKSQDTKQQILNSNYGKKTAFIPKMNQYNFNSKSLAQKYLNMKKMAMAQEKIAQKDGAA